MGQVVFAPGNPFTSLFMQDPLFHYSLFPLPTNIRLDEKRRLNRVYYPRTRKILTNNYQVMTFYDARVDYFTDRQFQDLADVFREDGMVSFTVHSLSWWIWQNSVLLDVSPINDYKFRFESTWRVSFRDRYPISQPFVELGIEKVTGWEYAILDVKQSAKIWADMVPQNTPWLVSWRPGDGNAGLQWVFGDKYDNLWWGKSGQARDRNPYVLEFATNLILYSLDRDLISDIHARREAKRMLSIFRTRELLIISMLNWAENFGANTFSISMSLSELEEKFEEAVDRYLEQDYNAATTFMDELDNTVTEISARAERMKDQALFWVYLSEWLVVTSVAMVAGFLLWTLMVKRSLYRPVGGTRISDTEHRGTP